MTTIAIVQSCYIPWKGYFDLIRRSDRFVLYDCVQYTTYDWRNRNRIKTANGLHWLTVPITYVSQTQRICDTLCADQPWQEQHWETLRHAYTKAPCFTEFAPAIEGLYQSCDQRALSEVNQHFLTGIKALLNISTPLELLKEQIDAQGDKTEKLVAICKHYGATRYLSGPSAKAYLDFPLFEKAGIEVEWMQYEYPEYKQLHPPFTHEVSILDVLFNTGAEASRFSTSASAQALI